MSNIRIATWNLERPKLRGNAKNARRLQKLREVSADLLVLTETSAAIALEGYESAASPPIGGYHSDGENATTIWSKWPITTRKIKTFDPSLAVCAEVQSPLGPMLIYGTIITYANYRGPDKSSKRWVEHRKSIDGHFDDWQRLRRTYPEHLVCVAGDFNQSRDGSGWYEDAESVEALGRALESCSLTCLTSEDLRANGKLKTRATVDHICVSASLARRVTSVGAWEGTATDGVRLSDHNGVIVDLRAGS